MNGCHALVSPTFDGLSNLRTIGRFWMVDCSSLVSPNWHGLSTLTTVGPFWMTMCHSLISPNFDGLTNLTTVGPFWMSNCASLVSPSFTGLHNLETVGTHCTYQCPMLLTYDFKMGVPPPTALNWINQTLIHARLPSTHYYLSVPGWGTDHSRSTQNGSDSYPHILKSRQHLL